MEKAGHSWANELNDMLMSRPLAEALLEADPGFAKDAKQARAQLREQYPNREDVSIEQMVDAIRAAFTRDGRFPLTLIVLDEVQQYIGEDPQRTYDVQEAVEACCSAFGGKLLFAATGQTAMAGTPNLQKLMGRFPVKVELSDTDVETVIRKVILAKKPEAISKVNEILKDCEGELARHLVSTEIGYRPEEAQQLREALNRAQTDFAEVRQREMTALEADPAWRQLDAARRSELVNAEGLQEVPPVATGTEAEVLASLRSMSLGARRDRTEALPERFGRARLAATKILAPKATRVSLPSRTLQNADDARQWLQEVETLVVDAVKKGPVVV